VDVPCSGLGTIRRDPDIRWRRTETDLASLAEDELIMLREAARAVRPAGRLIYATCSSEPEENESIVSSFLATEQRFARADPQVGPLASLRDASGALRTLPHLHNLEAFYAAILVHLET
jgi:16S rRNA (cytosine967-C5)-methyltransferase